MESTKELPISRYSCWACEMERDGLLLLPMLDVPPSDPELLLLLLLDVSPSDPELLLDESEVEVSDPVQRPMHSWPRIPGGFT